MSLIVAVKDKNRFVLGADKQCSTGSNKEHGATKIWEVGTEGSGIIMGGVGSVRATQIIQYSEILDLNCLAKGATTEYITRSLVPEIVHALESNGINCAAGPDDPTKIIPNAFFFAIDDKAWVIWNDLSVIEIEDYFAIGSGADVARGALFATKKLNPFERIVTCIDAAAETTLFVDDGVDLLATDITDKDIPLIKKALGIIDIVPKKEPVKEPEKPAAPKKKAIKKEKKADK